ncbi:MAG: hypothetical protein LBJ01_10685 [Tannerella sp.]|jgi:hypothetical protein|nr:hypothetical protein [Tannerella sp.]
MDLVKATAHQNELTKEKPVSYYLLSTSRGTLYIDDVIHRMESKQIATKNVNGKVATQSTASGSTLTKDVREYVYPNPVTVV